jgi:integrase
VRVFKNGKNYAAQIWIEGKTYRFSSGLSDQRAAQKAAERYRSDLIAQLKNEERAGSSLFISDVAVRYMLDVGDHHKGKDNTERLVRLLIKHFKEKLLTEITHEDALALRRKRRAQVVRGQQLSPATVNDTIEQLKKLFTYCKAAGATFAREPRWKELWLEEPREHVRELSASEAERLDAAIAKCRPDYWPLLEFARTTAKRKMNCINLEWSQVHWERGVIELKGKGTAGGKPITVPITKTVRSILWPLRGDHPTRVFTFVAERTIDKVIRGKRHAFVKGERYPITKDGLKRVWNAVRTEAGLRTGENRFRFHDLRHDFASKALRSVTGAAGIKVVSAALDHSDISITLRTYAHLLGDEVADVIETLASKRRKTAPPSGRKLKAVS